MSTLFSNLVASAATHQSNIAIASAAHQITYGDLLSRVYDQANILKQKGDFQRSRIILTTTATLEFLVDYFSLLHLGAVPFLLDHRTPPTLAGDIKRKYLLSELDETPLPSPDSVSAGGHLKSDTETCRFTSGSTGMPKALEFSGQTIASAATAWIRATSQRSDDRVLCLAPLANGLGFNVALVPTLLSGGTLILVDGIRTPASLFRQIEKHQVTRLVAAPVVYDLCARSQTPLPPQSLCLKLALSAAAPLTKATRQRFRELSGAPLVDYFGIAETGPVTFEVERIWDEGLGTPLPGAQLRFDCRADHKELLVRTAWMASGYVGNKQEFESRFTADGFFRTRDIGDLRSGRLFVDGRLDNLVNIAGAKFNPDKVTAVACDHAKVVDAYTYVQKNGSGENELALCVVSKGPGDRWELIAYLSDNLPTYMVPARLQFVPSIPKNGVGKPLLSEIQKLVQEQ